MGQESAQRSTVCWGYIRKMLTLGDIDSLERQLKASIVALNKKKIPDVTIVEVIDDAAVWPASFEQLAPLAPTHSLDNLLIRSPLFLCAVAAEIGFRFEGVGTVFWAKLADALGLSITMAHRQRIADAFEALAARYSLSRPRESPFSRHFSIIAWPIANALLPVDLVGPVSRLMARAPVAGLPGSGRSVNFASLRAWASAAEGARLADWLRLEGPATRVLTALLTENRSSVLSRASYTRLRDAVAVDSEAFFAARAARLRIRAIRVVPTAEQSLGRLSVSHDSSGVHFFASWPILPPALFDEARGLARSAGWRPRLWGAGSLLHPDNALGPGPFALALSAVPNEDDPPYRGAADLFGAGSEIAAALAARSIDWTETLFFEPNEDRTRAEQRLSRPNGSDGTVWIATVSEKLTLWGLRKLGDTCGYSLYEADLADSANRAVLVDERLLGSETRRTLARHPIDAIGAGPGVVSPNRPFLFYRARAGETEGVPQELAAGGIISPVPGSVGSPGVRAEAAAPANESIVDVILFERDSAFEALVEHRLQLRVESRLPLVNVPISADLEIDGVLVARGRDQLATLPAALDDSGSALLAPLYEDTVRAKLLKTGKGRLRIAVGRSVAIEITLQRAPASVDWSGEVPHLLDSEMHVSLVGATAHAPHRFVLAATIATPARGAAAFGLKLSDGRIADPLRLLTSDVFNYGDFTANFAEDVGSRRMFDQGKGVGDFARSRVAWARALCTSLSALAAKSRVVRQFEEPLVVDLCGRTWSLAEARIRDRPIDPHAALWFAAVDRGLAILPDQAVDAHSDVFGRAFAKHARAMDPDWPIASPSPVDGAMDDALNVAFSEALVELHGRGDLLDVDDDFDFGSPAEDWEAAAASALRTIERASLTRLLAPTDGARQLAKRAYSDVGIAELAEDLAAWTKTWALPRGQLSAEMAACALQLWMSPAACDGVDAAVHVLASDPFVARATRYVAIRLGSNHAQVAQ
jgi:hypothetical protein